MSRRTMMLKQSDTFVPDRFEVVCNYAKLLKRATVQVAASFDVAYVTINGSRDDEQHQAGSSKSFRTTFTQVTAGTEFVVIGFNSYGLPTQVYTVIAD